MRNATNNDLARIVEIYNMSIKSGIVTADTEIVSIVSKQSWFNAHHQTRPLLVHEIDGHIVAWVSFQDFYGRPAYHVTAELSIYIDQNFHGRGIGTQLVNAAISLCPSLGIKKLLGFVFSENTKSIALLNKTGFTSWGELPEIAVIDNTTRSLTIMGLTIPAVNETL